MITFIGTRGNSLRICLQKFIRRKNLLKYLIVEPKSPAIAPNIALMKWARWCEQNGHEYQFVRGIVEPNIIPDKILMSCVFTFYSKVYEETIDYYIENTTAMILIGGVFPTLNPEWFNKPKWTGGYVGLKRIEIFHGMCPEIDNIPPKYNVVIKSEQTKSKEKEYVEAQKQHTQESQKQKNELVLSPARELFDAPVLEDVPEKIDDDPYHRNRIVLYASRGCVNKCGYCAVPKLEGDMHSFESIKDSLDAAKEDLPDAKGVVLYDNNFTEHEFFDNIIDELKDFGKPIDIHGLHVDSFTWYQAKRLSELRWLGQGQSGTAYIRFSFDKWKYADNIRRALKFVKDANLKAGFFCYMLYNFHDTPDDYWNRIVVTQGIVDEIGRSITLYPQRYEPFTALHQNAVIGPEWTEDLLRGVKKIYSQFNNFLPVTESRNLFRWIGFNKWEFFERSLKILNNTYKLHENVKDMEPPTTKKLLKYVK